MATYQELVQAQQQLEQSTQELANLEQNDQATPQQVASAKQDITEKEAKVQEIASQIEQQEHEQTSPESETKWQDYVAEQGHVGGEVVGWAGVHPSTSEQVEPGTEFQTLVANQGYGPEQQVVQDSPMQEAEGTPEQGAGSQNPEPSAMNPAAPVYTDPAAAMNPSDPVYTNPAAQNRIQDIVNPQQEAQAQSEVQEFLNKSSGDNLESLQQNSYQAKSLEVNFNEVTTSEPQWTQEEASAFIKEHTGQDMTQQYENERAQEVEQEPER